MTEDEEFGGVDFQEFLNNLRKSASVKAGAVIFGEAQVAYYDTLKAHMSDEDAFNLTAHTTECIIRGGAEAVGPVVSAVLQASFLWERFGPQSDKEVPGGN